MNHLKGNIDILTVDDTIEFNYNGKQIKSTEV